MLLIGRADSVAGVENSNKSEQRDINPGRVYFAYLRVFRAIPTMFLCPG